MPRRDRSRLTRKEKEIDGWRNMTESRGERKGRPEVGRGDSQGTSSSFMTAPA
jgi:hypothetical protein